METDSFTIEEKLAPALEALGLFCFGWLVMEEAPFTGRKAVLIGNRAGETGHKMWDVFSTSSEYLDGLKDPMNRWTERVVDKIARDNNAAVIYPFGLKLWPFQRYAKIATGMNSSPLGLLIHPQFGLWSAFRAVLIFGENVALDLPKKMNHVCDECAEKPCLSACPVKAFSKNGFAVDDCRGHLVSGNPPECMTFGCRARAACPVGVPYSDAQIRFHMKAFS